MGAKALGSRHADSWKRDGRRRASDEGDVLSDQNIATLKAPSAGAMLELRAPVAPQLGDMLAAACVDFSVLPRGYIA
ncbi:hypothetical protein [Mycobacterium sp.]|jgi:hypothetical protein|uniref:hypothetical protein n=1 Tax=Mycobacterium sp. TaxID=1785 RepID=UPI00260CED8B|nr:hypothetical protein [Mycobacterium sp.]